MLDQWVDLFVNQHCLNLGKARKYAFLLNRMDLISSKIHKISKRKRITFCSENLRLTNVYEASIAAMVAKELMKEICIQGPRGKRY